MLSLSHGVLLVIFANLVRTHLGLLPVPSLLNELHKETRMRRVFVRRGDKNKYTKKCGIRLGGQTIRLRYAPFGPS